VTAGELAVDEGELDFGMIRLGESSTGTLTIRNPGRSVVDWNIRIPESVCGDLDASELEFCPSSGSVLPLGVCSVEVTFRPNRTRCLNTVLELVSASGAKVSVIVYCVSKNVPFLYF